MIPIEIVTTASELGTKMGKLNSSMIEETDQTKTKRIYSTEMDLSAINPAKGNQNTPHCSATCINICWLNSLVLNWSFLFAGLSNMKLDDVEEFVSVMKSMWTCLFHQSSWTGLCLFQPLLYTLVFSCADSLEFAPIAEKIVGNFMNLRITYKFNYETECVWFIVYTKNIQWLLNEFMKQNFLLLILNA